MQAITRAGLTLVTAALIAIGSSWYAWMDANRKLRRELVQVEERFSRLAAEHERFLLVVNAAMQARSEIDANYSQRGASLDEALERESGYACMPVPYDLVQRLRQSAAAAAGAAASSAGAASADAPASPGED